MAAGASPVSAISSCAVESGTSAMRRMRLTAMITTNTTPANSTGRRSLRARAGASHQRRRISTLAIAASARPP